MPLTIDITGQHITVTRPPRQQYEFQSVEDRQDGKPRKPRTDRATGQPLYAVELFIPGIGRPVLVNVPGEPAGLEPGQPAIVTGLSLNHWQMQRGNATREGVTYRADRIEPAAVRKAS